MKKEPFKMKGYSYPGTSPVKDSENKGETSHAMKQKIEEIRNANFKEINVALINSGKPPMSREEYDAGLDKKKANNKKISGDEKE